MSDIWTQVKRSRFYLFRNLAMGLTLFKLQKGFLWYIVNMAILSKLVSFAALW